jgi:molybdate transport system ATP-binding protein
MSGLEVRARDRLRELELDVELQVDGDGCAAIVGPSGAGKSTVLRIIAGLRRPDPGRVVMGEEVWLDSGRGIDLRPEERACGFMFQDYALFPHLTAWRNVAFGMPGPRQDRRGRALEQLQTPAPPPSREASASGWPWRDRWRATRASCSSMNPSPHSTPAPARTPAASSSTH